MQGYYYFIRLLVLLGIQASIIQTVYASPLSLQAGHSRTLQMRETISTVFISEPAVADYRVINGKTLVIYGKKSGTSQLTVYGIKSRILLDRQIDVGPFSEDLQQRITREYPNNNKVEVKRFMDGEKTTYILSGMVPDEETRDGIYQLVGSLVGTEKEIQKVGQSSESGQNSIHFMTRKVYDNVINNLTLPFSNQVNVRLTIVEVTKEFTDNLGIAWSSLTLGGIIDRNKAIVGPPGSFQLLGFKRGFDANNISTLINAVKNDNIARVLAQPNLTVLSGESASFLVGGELPILVNGQNDTVTVEYKEYGIRLAIAARVEKKQKIKLAISSELSNVAGSYGYNQYQIPILRSRKSTSTIELADGDSFAIGGLLSEADREALTKIPMIGDIPILGALARQAQTDREKTEMVVFASVNLVKPVSAAKQISVPQYRRTSVDRLFFNVGVNQSTREGRLEESARNFMQQGGFAY